MMLIRHIGVAAICAALTAACASSPPTQLVEARNAYDLAEAGPASDLAAPELLEAKKALERAEAAYDDDGADAKTKHLAYVAQRRAQIAATIGERRVVEEDVAAYNRQRERTAREIQRVQNELEREKAARIQAEVQLDIARQQFQMVESKRGLIVTLSDGVMFASGSSQIRPGAHAKLAELASFIRTLPGRNVLVEGHTDSEGSEDDNQRLSEQRAESVADFLALHGVERSRITTAGYGEGQPIATNATDVGRAQNRRVQVVLQPTAILIE